MLVLIDPRKLGETDGTFFFAHMWEVRNHLIVNFPRYQIDVINHYSCVQEILVRTETETLQFWLHRSEI